MNWKDYKQDMDHIQHSQRNHQTWISAMQEADYDKQIRRVRLSHFAVVITVIFMVMIQMFPVNIMDQTPLLTKKADSTMFHQPIKADLPKISIGLTAGGMGFPGIDVRNHQEIERGNPWREDYPIETLPVYKNGIQLGPRNEILQGGLSDQMMEERFNLYEDRLSFTGYLGEKELDVCKSREYNEGKIHIYYNGVINIEIDKDVYPITQKLQATTREEAQQQSLALAQELHDVLRLKQPAPYVSLHYNNENEACWDYGVYDEKDDPFEDMYSYNMNQITFSETDNILYIRIQSYVVGEMIGSYPVISLDEARQRFIDGEYLSLSLAPASDLDIAKIELIYHRSDISEYIVPMYLIYAAVDPSKLIHQDGLTCYGFYYVPAIESQYVEIYEKNDLKFN